MAKIIPMTTEEAARMKEFGKLIDARTAAQALADKASEAYAATCVGESSGDETLWAAYRVETAKVAEIQKAIRAANPR